MSPGRVPSRRAASGCCTSTTRARRCSPSPCWTRWSTTSGSRPRSGATRRPTRRRDRLERTYDAVAALIGAAPDEIALVDSHTTGWNAAVHAFPLAPATGCCSPGPSTAPTPSPCCSCGSAPAASWCWSRTTPTGQVDLEAFAAALADRTRGLRLPRARADRQRPGQPGRRGRDACAGPPVCPSCSTPASPSGSSSGRRRHRLRRPRRRRAQVPPRPPGHGLPLRPPVSAPPPPAPHARPARGRLGGARPLRDARRRAPLRAVRGRRRGPHRPRAWPSTTRWAGASTPSRHASARWPRACASASRDRRREVHDKGARRSAITTFTVAGVPAAEVAARLRAQAINASVTTQSFARLDLPHRGLPDLVRASVALRDHRRRAGPGRRRHRRGRRHRPLTPTPRVLARSRRSLGRRTRAGTRGVLSCACGPAASRGWRRGRGPRAGAARGSGGRSAGSRGWRTA